MSVEPLLRKYHLRLRNGLHVCVILLQNVSVYLNISEPTEQLIEITPLNNQINTNCLTCLRLDNEIIDKCLMGANGNKEASTNIDCSVQVENAA